MQGADGALKARNAFFLHNLNPLSFSLPHEMNILSICKSIEHCAYLRSAHEIWMLNVPVGGHALEHTADVSLKLINLTVTPGCSPPESPAPLLGSLQ